MSDIDTAKIRALWADDPPDYDTRTVRELCDALDATRAAEKHQHSEREYERAQKHAAEAELAAAEARIAAALGPGGWGGREMSNVDTDGLRAVYSCDPQNTLSVYVMELTIRALCDALDATEVRIRDLHRALTGGTP